MRSLGAETWGCRQMWVIMRGTLAQCGPMSWVIQFRHWCMSSLTISVGAFNKQGDGAYNMWFSNYWEYQYTLMSKLEKSNGPLSRTHALIVLSPTSKLNSNSLTRDGTVWSLAMVCLQRQQLRLIVTVLLIINPPAAIGCIHHSFFQVVTSLSSVFCLQFLIWHVSVELEFCTHI